MAECIIRDHLRSTIARYYYLKQLSAEDRDNYEKHFIECPKCADTLREVYSMSVGRREKELLN